MIQNFDAKDFLTHYWQKKPLLIRNAFPSYECPISPEELAGLACEEFVESRVIKETKASPKWSLEKGPFSEDYFTNLPESHWTLLIQGLNKLFPEMDDLLHSFDFIPTWRIDDLMASYAAPGGSVGPHIDQYDVFLLQVKGQRRWMISEQAVDIDNFEEDVPLKIIKKFVTEQEWILNTGDMLYLPPNVAHYGIGLENCMTFSIGFRAPSHSELLSDFTDERMASLSDEQRYQDNDLEFNLNSGEINAEAINKIQKTLLSQVNNREFLENWFGRFITHYLNDDSEQEHSITLDDFKQLITSQNTLRRSATTRANYIHSTKSGFKLFINGDIFPTEKDIEQLAILFCDKHIINIEPENELTTEKNIIFLHELYCHGYIEVSDE